ncbi:MAG: hypothetical protein F6K11_24500 [Leptolyngbya sp. SIO3F4]|nr:hypothetical protein [Leptolyngbya sp. SIO3F4]
MTGVYVSSLSVTSNSEEENLIRQVFEQYRAALSQYNGEAALVAMDTQSVAWYGEVLEYALTLDRDALNQLNLIEKFNVIRLRNEFSQDELEKLTGEALIIINVERGWTVQLSVDDMELTNVEISDSFGAITFDEKVGPISLFIKEDRQWRFMHWKVIDLANSGFEEILQESGLPEDEFIARFLDLSLPFDERIFEGPIAQ